LYSAELTDEICRLLAEGNSMLQITNREDMPVVSVIYDWLHKNKDFADKYVRAREDQAHTIADRAVAMALHGSRAITDPQIAKVQLDAIKWTAARLAPRIYGDKAELNVGGQTDNPVATVIRWER
jgi:hypothetical protein